MSAKPSHTPARHVVAVVGTKGGIGKTTVTNGLAGALALKGRLVSVIDVDPQGSSFSWAETAARNGIALPYGVGTAGRGSLSKVVEDSLSEWILIDGPPGNTDVTLAMLAVADVALIPTQPESLALDRLSSTLRLIGQASTANPVLGCLVVVNQADRRTSEAWTAPEILRHEGIPVADTVVPRLARINRAFGTNVVSPAWVALADELIAAVGAESEVAA